MIILTETTESDVEQIREWLVADPDHKTQTEADPEWMLTGQGLLSFCIVDAKGPICYVRFDQDSDLVRVATQFAPESVVSKRRVILGLIKALIPTMLLFAKDNGFKGLVFKSTSESLIGFMKKQKFMLDKDDDYVLLFEDGNENLY